MFLVFLYYLLLHQVLGTVHGGCSQKCQTSPGSEHQLTDVLASTDNSTSRTSPPPFPCSCSPSCSVYRDCCYDSLYRDSNRTVRSFKSHTMCVSVEGSGRYRAVAKCPAEWPESNQFCGESIGHLPPVTSKTTGITYANVYCAVCHDDGEDLLTWSVDLRCCPEHDSEPERYFSHRNNNLYSHLTDGRSCLCRYHPRNNSLAFLSGLELRGCSRNLNREISRCSYSWSGDDAETERLCPLYKDPVYTADHVYKNPHCAKCNYKEEQDTQCVPAVVARMFAQGANITEISRYCESNRLKVCLHYTTAMSKGHEYSYHRILNINRQSCVPDPGEMCCEGERYHFKSKRCKKLVP